MTTMWVGRSRPPRILIVEDTKALRTLLDYVLHLEGFDVASTGDATSAQALALRFAPDVVLLDVCLPGMSGFEIARALRTEGRLASLRVVFMSGRKTEADQAEATGLGAAAYLEKPFRIRELVAVAKDVLGAKDDSHRLNSAGKEA